MATTVPKTTAHEDASRPRQPGETGAWEAARPGSQGPNAVHGPWCSAGEAGRHLRTKAGQRPGTPSPAPVPLRLERIATQAQPYPDMAVTPLAHPLDVARLERAFGRLTPHRAPGEERVPWPTYKATREPHLAAFPDKRGKGPSCPPPGGRRLSPHRNGQRRPRGRPALEANSGAQAVARLLEALYAQDCCDFSDGVRPGRRPPHALQAVRQGWLTNGMGDVSDGAISACCDNWQPDTRFTRLRKRIQDGRVLALSERWLHAGIRDGKAMVGPDTGSPQGAVRSPL